MMTFWRVGVGAERVAVSTAIGVELIAGFLPRA